MARSMAQARRDFTREEILTTAQRLFTERGVRATSIGQVAAVVGMTRANLYYYFSSKESIVLAFYHQMQESSNEAILQAMAGHKKLKERIRCVLDKRIELLAPNRKFCDALFRHAPDRDDPLSPFSEETRPIREGSIEHLRAALDGGDVKVPPDMKIQLPYLLWLYQMGIILFWIYDRSPGQQRTEKLLEKSLGLLVSLLKISGLPLMKPLRKTALELVETLAP